MLLSIDIMTGMLEPRKFPLSLFDVPELEEQ